MYQYQQEAVEVAAQVYRYQQGAVVAAARVYQYQQGAGEAEYLWGAADSWQ